MIQTKLALLGCGDVAQRDYLPEMQRLAGRYELVAVCGRSPERVERVARQYAVRAWYTDYTRMLAETDAEAVINLTPMQLHDETNLAIVMSGRHLYSEKPFASAPEAGRRIAAIAQQRNLVVVAAPCVLLFPQLQLARSLLDEGALGRITSAHGIGFGGVPPWAGFASDPSQYFAAGGGPLRDMGVYPLHALTGLLGPARRVSAMASQVQHFTIGDGPFVGKQIPIEEADNWHLLLDFGDGRLATVEANNCAQATRAPQLELFGLQATLAVDLLNVAAPLALLRAGSDWATIEVPHAGRASGPDHLLGIEHLLDCVQQQIRPILSASHALHVLDIIEQAGRSAADGRSYDLASTFYSRV